MGLLLAVLLAGVVRAGYGQGKTPLRGDKSFQAALTFLPSSKLAEGYSQINLASPNDKDPLVDPYNWYTDGDRSMRGMVSDAVLFFQWWVRTSEPTERYKFDWKSSGYFEVRYVDDKGMSVTKYIQRSKLEKYPNLLQRFDNIKPLDITFEINFRTGNIEDQPYYDYRRKYNINSDLGSAGYKIDYTRLLEDKVIVYRSNDHEQKWTLPGRPIGGWDEFLNYPSKHADKRTAFIELFQLGNDAVIQRYKIARIRWRVDDFVYIAKKFEEYESGKDKPTAFDEVAAGRKEEKAGDGFWDETEEAPCKLELAKNLDNTTTDEGVVTISGKVAGPKTMLTAGKVMAEGYEQAFTIGNDGSFETKVVLRAGLNRIKVVVCSKSIEQNITLKREPVDLRATLTWNSGSSDIDLYVSDPDNQTCYYQNKLVGNMRLDVDNTRGYGPENIYVAKVKKGTYTIKAQNYSRGEGSEATIYVFINEKLKDIHKIRFTSGKEFVTVGSYSF